MNYEIIKDLSLLENFLDFLPDLKSDEQFYVCLMSRNKYAKELVHLKSDREQLKRFTATKKNLINKIKQLECKLGSYMHKDVEAPQESLALYINPNPRSFKKAFKNILIQTALILTSENEINQNPYQLALTEIHKAKSRNVFIDFDIDDITEEEFLNKFHENKLDINLDSLNLLKTRGGVHLLVTLDKIEKEYTKVWYNSLVKTFKPDQVGDNMIPIPGCVQGNFVPYFFNF